MNNTETYKRGQIEKALWKFFSPGRRGDSPPKVFLTRIKRLLEVDRLPPEKSEMAHTRYAFADALPEGQGNDVAYQPFDAFCLALALDLLDIGFKQAEIVYLLRHIREELKGWFERILLSPPATKRQRLLPRSRPDAPTYVDADGHKFADPRVFVVIGKVEITEIFQASGEKSGSSPLILQPVYCRGIDKLCDELHRMNAKYRKVVVVEIAEAAAGIGELLLKEPETKRGRG